MQIGRAKGTMSEMNIVPLIDILLVLIIIFMVIAPVTPKGLEASLPQPGHDGPLPPTVVVQVGAGGALRINGEEETWETLGLRLETIFKERAEKVAFVKGDSPVEFGQIARAIDIMRGSGIDKVGLITVKLEAGQ